MLEQITPVILTFNEAPNIGRTLEKLTWARDVVVVDSMSDDETPAIVAKFPNARFIRHPITSLADQWNFAVAETGIASEWVLTLGADCVLTDELIAELDATRPDDEVAAYRINFTYCVHGIRLRASVYPPDYKLFRRRLLSFVQDGHTDRARFEGQRAALKGHILHDDRKSVSRFVWSQNRYQLAEAEKLLSSPSGRLDRIDRLRRGGVLAPFAVFFYCLLWKGLILDGKAGLHYCFQRTLAEMILALNLLDIDLRREADGSAPPSPEPNSNR